MKTVFPVFGSLVLIGAICFAYTLIILFSSLGGLATLAVTFTASTFVILLIDSIVTRVSRARREEKDNLTKIASRLRDEDRKHWLTSLD